MGWNNQLAKIWTKMVGPSRPSISELAIYTECAHLLMENRKDKLKLLILGSTPEFRDWGYEENMEVWVMDANLDYNKTINREIRHKNIISNKLEHFIHDYWQNLNFENFFDIIIGDLAIGNIPSNELEDFIKKVNRSLCKDGLFLGKSFYIPRNYKHIDLKKLCQEYYKGPKYHPYSYFSFYLTMESIKGNVLDFKDQYDNLIDLYNNGFMSQETLKHFENVGWDSEMKFKFYVPSVETFESLILKYMDIIDVKFGKDIYSPNFPLYIIKKRGGTKK